MKYSLIYQDQQGDKTLLNISLLVIAIHSIFMLSLMLFGEARPPQKHIERLIVKTISLQTPPKISQQLEKPKIETTAPLPPPIAEKQIEAAETPKIIEELTPPIPPPSDKKEEIAPKSKPETALDKTTEPPKPKPSVAKKKPVEPKKNSAKSSTDKPKVSKAQSNQKKETKVAPKSAAAQKSSPTPSKSNTVKKTETVKSTPKTEPTIDPKVEAAKAKKRELLAYARKSVAQLDQSHNSASTSTFSSLDSDPVPSQIKSLQVETFATDTGEQLSPREVGYYEELASRLKLQLRLPEYGAVKIKLTLSRPGRFVKVAIVNAKSDANRKYIEKTLPTLTYPSFGNNFSSQAEYTFVVSLSNDL